MEKELNPKQQTSEAIRAAESILIITGQNPTIDQVASVVALNEILRKLGKKSNALISDTIPAGARFLADGKIDKQLEGLRDFIMQLNLSNSEVDKLKYTIENGKLNVHITPFRGGFSQQDVTFAYGDYHYDLVIVIGVAAVSRIDKLYLQNADLFKDVPVVNIDFHRVNESYGAVNLVDTYAASLSEMLVALAESLQNGIIDEPIATMLLTGIMAATDRFTAYHTTPKALTVAAQMMAAGANQQKVVKGLYPPRQRSDEPKKDQPRSDRARQDSRPAEQKPRSEAPAQQPAAQNSNSQPHKQMIAGGAYQRSQITTPSAVESTPAPVAPENPVYNSAPAANPAQEDQAAAPVEAYVPTEQPKKTEPVLGITAHNQAKPSSQAESFQPHPQQTKLSDEPEPLINAEEPRTPMPPNPLEVSVSNAGENTPNPKDGKGVNPANNPIFAGR